MPAPELCRSFAAASAGSSMAPRLSLHPRCRAHGMLKHAGEALQEEAPNDRTPEDGTDGTRKHPRPLAQLHRI
jgi:hypothetical protein